MARELGYSVTVQIAIGGDKASVRIPARGASDEQAIGRAIRSYAQALAELRSRPAPRPPALRPWWTK
jgi:hypothetical protein